MQTISLRELRSRIEREEPNNSDPLRGYALVNVLSPEVFLSEHIPGSLNIPRGREYEFERRFEHGKEIIVYCASHSCHASEQVADMLYGMGFTNVVTYEGGMEEWRSANSQVESGPATVQEINIA